MTNMKQETILFLCTLRLSFYLTVGYDLLCFLRRIFPLRRCEKLRIALEDLLFWGICLVKMLELLQTKGNGCVRWYVAAAVICEVWIYLKSLHPVFEWAFQGVLRLKSKLWRKAAKHASESHKDS